MSSKRKMVFQIRGFKSHVMDPEYGDKTWNILEHAFHQIYNHNTSGLSFEELHRYFLIIPIIMLFSFDHSH
ncbi:putative cullin repeat-like-containing domain-containing protein [Medicago truncatula]|uniref:Putative cullin repeat-like-containing domain-containing protein n=1 Tax=Medicago truncatula TaxID=3880 RepID=A0A396H1A2_MEDTR|nr:putative cullin repeat-like-containing domain-containing protein [Medicago truncatula]